jgi:hypothetical protein
LTWGLRHFCGNRKRTLLRLNIDDAQARGGDHSLELGGEHPAPWL